MSKRYGTPGGFLVDLGDYNSWEEYVAEINELYESSGAALDSSDEED